MTFNYGHYGHRSLFYPGSCWHRSRRDRVLSVQRKTGQGSRCDNASTPPPVPGNSNSSPRSEPARETRHRRQAMRNVSERCRSLECFVLRGLPSYQKYLVMKTAPDHLQPHSPSLPAKDGLSWGGRDNIAGMAPFYSSFFHASRAGGPNQAGMSHRHGWFNMIRSIIDRHQAGRPEAQEPIAGIPPKTRIREWIPKHLTPHTSGRKLQGG
ncbi:hypothetical protein B0I35DRAFT_209310 [Stachybotrys elegans]|uniref:Uncharacterized protein n=1 Tax=Stachybotrys elegans TaxID=80388 RepID=A0A8K0SW11_9HYPO|nr:hypothetical protein B0I35DRAFT_209310 [Stachybotrys elegans]